MHRNIALAKRVAPSRKTVFRVCKSRSYRNIVQPSRHTRTHDYTHGVPPTPPPTPPPPSYHPTKSNQYTYVDDDSNRLLTVYFGDGGFWEKGKFEERFPGVQNPWGGANPAAPYDQKFYVVMNVAVGGVSGFFPDGVVSWCEVAGGYLCSCLSCTEIVREFAQGWQLFSLPGVSTMGKVTMSGKMSLGRPCRDLSDNRVFEVDNLPIVEISDRAELHHPCAKGRTIVEVCTLNKRASCVQGVSVVCNRAPVLEDNGTRYAFAARRGQAVVIQANKYDRRPSHPLKALRGRGIMPFRVSNILECGRFARVSPRWNKVLKKSCSTRLGYRAARCGTTRIRMRP